jgi:maleylacetate reductase
VVLPYVLALNARSVPRSEQRMAVAFAAASAIEGLQRLRAQVDAPRALSLWTAFSAPTGADVPDLAARLPAIIERAG